MSQLFLYPNKQRDIPEKRHPNSSIFFRDAVNNKLNKRAKLAWVAHLKCVVQGQKEHIAKEQVYQSWLLKSV